MKRGNMDKKGQVTAFVILGIVILAGVILILYLRGQFFFGPATPSSLSARITPIKEHITSCIQEVSPEYIERIGMQGGHLKLGDDTYRKREDIPISYLCYNIESKPTCYNRMLLISEMENELNDAIRKGLATCINLGKYKKGFEITTGTLDVKTEIGEESVLVNVNYPITLTKGETKASEDKYSVNLNYPLGKLYNAAQDIIDAHTTTGNFEQLRYMLDHKGEYTIEVMKPYPDILYILTAKGSPYIFQFFVQGEPA